MKNISTAVSVLIAMLIIAGCAQSSVSVSSGQAYLTGTISAPSGVVPANRFLGVFVHTTVLAATNSGTNAAWLTICSSLPMKYTVGVEPGTYIVYAWLDLKGNLTNDSGDYEGFGFGGLFQTLSAGNTNTCDISLIQK